MFFDECMFLDYDIRNQLREIIPDGEMSEYCEMSSFESALVCGLLRKTEPKNILEVDVASGGTSAIILQAIKTYGLDSELISVDISKDWYRKRDQRPTGWQALNKFPDVPNWHLYTGKYLPEIIKGLNLSFDLCIIDTTHSLPGEVLDYLVAIKFMKLGSCMLFHDTQLFHVLHYYPQTYATKVLLDTCVGQKLYFRDRNSDLEIPNISGFRINADTYRYLDNSFSALSMKWAYMIDEVQFDIYNNFYKTYYGKNYSDFFRRAYENNKNMLNKSR